MCKGVLKTEDPITKASLLFTFVFKLPESYTDVRSLRSLLTDASPNHSLSARFEVASQIARSVCNVRSFGFVHKNLSPETILVLGNQNTSIGAAYLVGFDRFRTTQGNTARLGDSNWERNLYRHPRRQGASPEDIYIMQHDIYSLGICLLELGLWQSFVEYRALDGLPLRSAALRLQDGTPEMQYPTALKDHLVALARTALPQRMGTKYTEVVQTCLTCLDRENVDFGDEREFQDADGILVGVRYIEKVLMQLSLISV
ncbi:hypothetical protein P152DRAFT_474375 [Eremomyces bilateralis CBS 781.70]|uniref:Protein kinase domain-containing protein n=1 Tax=Eremomyces bilateralis CBS 781.70 TaxID=1392243 RepID=A0A6G1G0R1_9PEZI|nr:uncharacterized protein P152DRAFT_474375 [Eremomyces bilateralis CBS 781.70]KAF1811644.1 hypothetical protein P152DRAFT_474375 [Eremomyces bilateralis CBS 781.70]